MAFEPDFLELMPHVIQVYGWLSENFHGDDDYETEPREYRCRIVGKGLALRTKLSDQETVIYDIYVGPRIEEGLPVLDSQDDVFKLEDKIVLPEDQAWIDRTPEIFAIARLTDEGGAPGAHHHTKIQCGWMYHRQGQ